MERERVLGAIEHVHFYRHTTLWEPEQHQRHSLRGSQVLHGGVHGTHMEVLHVASERDLPRQRCHADHITLTAAGVARAAHITRTGTCIAGVFACAVARDAFIPREFAVSSATDR